jgi:outer membrane lipoprotein-sorting protein
MQKLLSLALLAAVLFISACGNKETAEDVTEKDTYIRPLTKTVETYKEDATDKEIIEYTYDKPGDFFWVKAEYKAEDCL